MRPKSIATVVVVFCCTKAVSSIPIDFSVSASSVRRGLISLTVPTRVVFPTPKPPATRILTAMALSERMESIDHVLQYALVGELGHRRRSAYNDQSMVEQVAQENPDDPGGHVKLGGRLGHRERRCADLDG